MKIKKFLEYLRMSKIYRFNEYICLLIENAGYPKNKTLL